MQKEYRLPDITIESAQTADFPTIAQFHQEMFREIAREEGSPWSEETLSALPSAFLDYLVKQSSTQDTMIWCARHGQTLVACACLTVASWPPVPADLAARAGLIHTIYVHPEYRRRGIARQLLETVLEYCRARKVRRLQLGASKAGRHLYEKFGFAPSGSRMFVIL